MNNLEDMVVCPECRGLKEYYSCCGDEIEFDDQDDVVNCPTCHEPCVMDDCEADLCCVCLGQGEVPVSREIEYHKIRQEDDKTDEDKSGM